MILVDTSIWIDHLNNANEELIRILNSNKVCIHSFIIGELACGNISNRKEILCLLNALPRLEPAFEAEVSTLLVNKKLFGIGLGLVDINLIASALIHDVKIWTNNKSLKKLPRNLICVNNATSKKCLKTVPSARGRLSAGR